MPTSKLLQTPSNPRRVLMLLPYANVGGTERHVQLLSQGLRSQGVDVRVALPDGPAVDAFRSLGVAVREMPTPSVLSMPAWLKGIRQEIADGADVVHIHAAMEMVWASHWASATVPRVFTAHGYHVEFDYMKAGVMLNRSASRVISVSEPEQARLLRYGLNSDLARVVPNGIDLESLAGPAGTLREDLRLPPDSRLIGMVNRLDAFKGVDLMLKAFSRLRDADSTLYLVIVGDGPERTRLEALTHELGLTHGVRWLGRRSDLGNVLRSFDAFVSPTRKEAFGMAVVEAMACGLPVLATDLPALREIVTPGQDGELVSADAGYERWAEALEGLLADADRMARYGVTARQRAQAFSIDEMARATREVYRDLLPNPTERVSS